MKRMDLMSLMEWDLIMAGISDGPVAQRLGSGICRSQPRFSVGMMNPRLSGSQALVNLNRLETHGMTLPLSLIESKVLFGMIESLRFSDLISESHQNQSKPRFGDFVCR